MLGLVCYSHRAPCREKYVWKFYKNPVKMEGIVSTRFCNPITARLCNNFDKIKIVAEAMGDVPVLDRSVNTDSAAAFVAELREYGADPARENHDQVSKLADDVEEAIPHIRYITKDELLAAHDTIIEHLNRYAAEQTDVRIQYCIMMPSFDQALKSNMWVGLRVLLNCHGPAWGLAASPCNQDLQALRSYATMVAGGGSAHFTVIQCLFFDDVMYSGGQMHDTIKMFQALYNTKDITLQAFACVPFVHRHNAWSFQYVHPAILDMVTLQSKDLPIAAHFIAYEFERDKKTTLTYTQTKVPDYASFPSWLGRLINPLAPEYDMWMEQYIDNKSKRGGAFPLFRNCENTDPTKSCMIGSYVPVLKRLQAADGDRKLRDFCVETDIALAFHAGTSSPKNMSMYKEYTEGTTAVSTKLADNVTTITASPYLLNYFNPNYGTILLSLSDVSSDKIQLFMDTVGPALMHFRNSGAILPTAVFIDSHVFMWRPGPAVDVFSLVFETRWKRLPGDEKLGEYGFQTKQFTVDGFKPEHLRELRTDFETRLADFVMPIVTAMHASGMAHGKIGDPASYRYGVRQNPGYAPEPLTLTGVMLHPASFTHVTFQNSVGEAEWAAAVTADLQNIETLTRAMVAMGTQAQALVPPKMTAPVYDKSDDDDDDDDDSYEALSRQQSKKRVRG